MKKYFWLVPAAYVAYMFGDKIVEGMAHSEEFQAIISVIPVLKPFAYTLTPLIGILDLTIAALLILIPLLLKSKCLKKSIFIWVIIWPFVPASLRYFGGVADFEIVEVLSISACGMLAYYLYNRYSK